MNTRLCIDNRYTLLILVACYIIEANDVYEWFDYCDVLSIGNGYHIVLTALSIGIYSN